MEKILQGNKITLGTCYYPEHWDESLWKDDLRRMKENGINAIRIAEFAWNKFESAEGNFNFGFFDRFLETAKSADISVIFCTPTATPPAWLTNEYPEVLNSRIDGTLLRHGARRHYNYNSPVYRRFTERLVEKIAEHYGKHPAIIGWQIDNEINCETDEFYSDSDTIAFREFLKTKYTTLDALNSAWGTVFWNQTYTAWAEVYVPRPTISDSVNPHEVLDYIRFVSQSARGYIKLQSDIIRKYIKPGDFITTNGMFSSLDNHAMNKESLDFYTYDSYPNFAYCLGTDPEHSADLNDRKWSRNLTEVRSISPDKFGIMEQQSGPNGWNTRMEAPSPRPGQMTLWTMQSIAHGADYVGYFRWRTCTMGTEIYWHGILDYSNRDNRRLAEVNDIWKKTQKISAIAGSKYQAAFGILKDYDNAWDAKLDKWHWRVDKESEAGIFQAAQLTHTPFDYVYINDDSSAEILSPYPVLFYPHAVIMTEKRAKLIENYVESGGTLILGCRTGYKDITGKCPMHKLPGLLQKISGADIVDYGFVSPDDGKVTVDWEGTEIEASVFNDIAEPLEQAKILGTFKNAYFAGKGGLIYNEYGKGRVFYFGGAFNQGAAKIFLSKLKIANPYGGLIDAPESCEIACRASSSKQYLFVLNYTRKPAQITLKKEMQDMYSGTKVSGTVELAAYGTAVYEIK
ncbi:beta-galactosidase [Leadbettera azotonutricia]|uniref:Beta-galactosidase n=1 Tax=Leadbettera azotonutricia (strain ATCC BAA-888 / DSM 13862 / ZAS-9) TaxID=545695 RepID=F5YBG4_LEAAZ|nr:beta-galactosidase [Leadbettera azotonutricia]AEF83220.1 beta-galactosidase [Leadbettera azotonutricia ZAS-9]